MIKFKLTLFLSFIYLLSFSQFNQTNLELISTAGDYFAPEGINIQLSFSVGESIIETYSTPDKSIILTQGFQQPDMQGPSSIEGYVTYNNTAHSPMSNTTVYLYNSELKKQDSSYTDVAGHFSFSNVPVSNYTLKCTTTKSYGGEDPADALLVNLNYIGRYNFRDALTRKASDLNLDTYTTSLDAFFINKRFIKLIDSYKSGDWAFEEPNININGTPVKRNIKAQCYGDIDGSYMPNKKLIGDLSLENEGTIVVGKDVEFELPVYVSRDMNLGAIGLVIDYPAEFIKVTGVISALPDLMFNILNGQVRIAWSDINLEGKYFNNTTPLIKLKMIAKSLSNDKDIILNLTSESKLSDNNGKSLKEEILHSPPIAFETIPTGFYLGQNYPNPSKTSSRIDYRLPESANVSLKIFDLLGKVVAEPVNGNQSSGSHRVNIDVSAMAEGVYMYKFVAEGTSSKFTKTRMMIISR